MKHKQCLRCRQAFEAHHAHCKRCPPCRLAHQQERQREHDRNRPRDYRTRILVPTKARYIYRADFQLHLDAMRAELQRQTGAMQMMMIQGFDPVEIPLSSMRRRTND